MRWQFGRGLVTRGAAGALFVASTLGLRVAHAQDDGRPWLGVDLTTPAAAAPGATTRGVVARHVFRSSPADRAGLRDGDVMVRVAGQAVNRPADVIAMLRVRRPGDTLQVDLERQGRASTVNVKLAPLPNAEEMLRADKLGREAPSVAGLQPVRGVMPREGLPKGKVVVLDFWAAWCGVCRAVTPVLNHWQNKYGAQGLVVLGVSSDTHPVATKASEAFGIKYAVGADAEEKVFNAFGVRALPTMFIVDKRGVVRELTVGVDVEHLAKVEALIARLLAEKLGRGRGASGGRVLRVLDEFLWSLRRAGVEVSTAQAIEAARALGLVGWGDRALLREALACVLVRRRGERGRFDEAFAAFFRAEGAHRRDWEARLRQRGVSGDEMGLVRSLLGALAPAEGDATSDLSLLASLVEGGGELDRRLVDASMGRLLEGLRGEAQLGYFAQRAIDRVGVGRARRGLDRLERELADVLGAERARAVVEALRAELGLMADEVRAYVEARLHASRRPAETGAAGARDVPFAGLNEAELDEVRASVRTLAERLRGAARVRERRARRGARLDGGATVRAAMATAGVPVVLVRRSPRRDRPKLWVLCDVSDSVRRAAGFMLEFVAQVHELFERTRSFVFVSEVGEVSRLFEREPARVALAKAYGGEVVPVSHNSNYGRVFASFDERYGRRLDRRSTLVVLGDGRTNFHPPGVEALARLRERVHTLLWLCPEPRAGWGTGDSAMGRYASVVDAVLPATTARELEHAARQLVVRR
ncbi:MAG TPA: VWA domain-containing protein [Polyangiaceae bacterium]|nr:VWA domain-containing protein [Polyangiaceae bacterium]